MANLNKVAVVYLLTGRALADRLVVSMYSLRKWYSGPILLLSTRAESHEIGELCAQDRRLRPTHLRVEEFKASGYASSYVSKVTCLAHCTHESAVFLDADTLVVGDISILLEAAHGFETTATVFCDVVTTHSYMASRIEAWREHLAAQRMESETRLLRRLTQFPFPMVNSGVFAVKVGGRFFSRWRTLAAAAHALPYPDEMSLQLLLTEHKHCVLGAQFNCYPRFPGRAADCRIWHFAGSSHLRMPEGREIWLPAYLECTREDLASLSKWSRVVPADASRG